MVYTLLMVRISEVGGGSSPLGRPPRNREIVSCRASCAQSVCQVEMDLKRDPTPFPFSLSARWPFTFPSVSSSEFQ